MSRLSATDALFAYAETRYTPMNMGSVQLLRLPEGYAGDFLEDLKAFISERLQYLPRLKKRLVVDTVGLPSWEDVEDFDLNYHVRRTRLRSPDEGEIARKLGRLQHKPFDFDKPLFMFYLIEGLEDGRLILFQKFHHTLADGKTAVRMMDLFSDEGMQRAVRPQALEARPSPPQSLLRRSVGGMADDAARTWSSLFGLASAGFKLLDRDSREMLKRIAARPITSLNQPLSEQRLFRYCEFSLEEVQAVRKAADLTFNDMGLALLGGALRRYLDELDALPEASLVCNVPVALNVDNSTAGNAVLSMWVPLGTHLADSRDRTGFIKEQADQAKGLLQRLVKAAGAGRGVQLPSLLVRAMALPLSSRRLAQLNPPPGNVAMSNVPAPREPIHVAGALVESIYGIPMLLQGQAIGTTFTSYAGKVVVGILCCEEAVPDPQRLLAYMEDELRAMKKLYRVGTKAKRVAKSRPRRSVANSD